MKIVFVPLRIFAVNSNKNPFITVCIKDDMNHKEIDRKSTLLFNE